jgi:hypothetical protein
MPKVEPFPVSSATSVVSSAALDTGYFKALHCVTSVLAVPPLPVFEFLMDHGALFRQGHRDGATMTA